MKGRLMIVGRNTSNGQLSIWGTESGESMTEELCKIICKGSREKVYLVRVVAEYDIAVTKTSFEETSDPT